MILASWAGVSALHWIDFLPGRWSRQQELQKAVQDDMSATSDILDGSQGHKDVRWHWSSSRSNHPMGDQKQNQIRSSSRMDYHWYFSVHFCQVWMLYKQEGRLTTLTRPLPRWLATDLAMAGFSATHKIFCPAISFLLATWRSLLFRSSIESIAFHFFKFR